MKYIYNKKFPLRRGTKLWRLTRFRDEMYVIRTYSIVANYVQCNIICNNAHNCIMAKTHVVRRDKPESYLYESSFCVVYNYCTEDMLRRALNTGYILYREYGVPRMYPTDYLSLPFELRRKFRENNSTQRGDNDDIQGNSIRIQVGAY